MGTQVFYLALFFVLLAGTLNAASYMNSSGINSQIIVVNATIQSLRETVIFIFIYVLGVSGAFSLYHSGRQTIRARSAEMFFLIGIALISVSLTLGYEILHVKCPPYGNCG